MTHGGYWAVLPAGVRHDRRLTQTAKLLYAEISSLAQEDGYCWAGDEYFASLFGCSVSTITRALRSLRDGGYIWSENKTNARGTERHIYCGLNPSQGGIVKNDDTPDDTLEGIVKNDDTPIVKNDDTPLPTQYKRNNVNTEENARACARERDGIPEDARTIFETAAGEDTELRDRLLDLAAGKKWKKRPDLAAKQLLTRLRKLSGGRRLLALALLDTAIEHGWESVYPLKEDELARLRPAERGSSAPDGDFVVWDPEEGET